MIVERQEMQTLLEGGWKAADLHVHTLHSPDVIPTWQTDPLTLYHRARELGLSYITFTDHNTMAAYDQIGWMRPGLVPGVELSLSDPRFGHTIHVNIYLLDRKQLTEVLGIAQKKRDAELLTLYLKAENLPFVLNHPFWHEPGEKLSFRSVVELAALFPVVEWNMGRIESLNRLTYRLAEKKGIGIIAATDTHIGQPGKAVTLAQASDFRDFMNRVVHRESRILPASLTKKNMDLEVEARLKGLFEPHSWLRREDSLAIETGVWLLDALVQHLRDSSRQRLGRSKQILRKALEAISKSGIPQSLYLASQHLLAGRVGKSFAQGDLVLQSVGH